MCAKLPHPLRLLLATPILFSPLLAFLWAPSVAAQCPDVPVASISSSRVPSDVCIPQNFPKTQNPIAFFDDYSWKTFIALVWPAKPSERGAADPGQQVNGQGPRVFETYKALWETFHTDDSAPLPWNSLTPDKANACSASPAFGDLVIASFSKFGDIGQAGFGTLVGPLVAQNRSYVRYLTGFNRVEFEQILNSKLYLRNGSQPNALPFQNSSLDVKSAWLVMKGVAHPERFYKRMALVLDPETNACSSVEIGLVGLHIVQKTPSRPQWIWSSFEQVDNVPPAAPDAPGTFLFNDGTGQPMPRVNPYSISPLPLPVAAPFNVDRLRPIHSSTSTTNAAYRTLLRQAGGPWQFYQLVMTQWPLEPNRPDLDGGIANTFPGQLDATSSFSNVTLETFEQRSVATGCMSCHTNAGTDFVWTVADHAFPSLIPEELVRDPAFRRLRSLMQLGAIASTAPRQELKFIIVNQPAKVSPTPVPKMPQ